MVHLVVEDAYTADGVLAQTPRMAKSVAMPRSLPELQQMAALHLWGGAGPARLRFYHKGREVLHATQVARLQDNDTVIVKTSKNVGVSKEGNAFAGDGAPTASTQKADYIRWAFGEKAKPGFNKTDGLRSHLADLEMGHPFDSNSLYRKDFPEHTDAKRAMKNLALQKSHILTGSAQVEKGSTYTDHFRRPEDHTAIQPANSSRYSVISSTSLGQPFGATSSYHIEYDRPKGFRTPRPERVAVNDNDSSLTDMVRIKPFKGMSTYQDHYVRFPEHQKTQPCRPINAKVQDHTFAGGTEYNDMYNEKTIAFTHDHINLLRED
eukprot:TRINITY_DN114341_c0_g1_i1.p1 TRINITY_DN114341_c0_g1~~TRINITY_DN114341_c0_g1_i1.p1  ORF type:complete len:321 (-),score=71.91 TRINITY_DN114341_c0_g1_i1:539-1501(-)